MLKNERTEGRKKKRKRCSTFSLLILTSSLSPFLFSPHIILNFGWIVEAPCREPLVDLSQDGAKASEERRERREHLGFVIVVAAAVSAVLAVAHASTAAPGDGREEGRAGGGELLNWEGRRGRRRREGEREKTKDKMNSLFLSLLPTAPPRTPWP